MILLIRLLFYLIVIIKLRMVLREFINSTKHKDLLESTYEVRENYKKALSLECYRIKVLYNGSAL